jgi:hypothetical protein
LAAVVALLAVRPGAGPREAPSVRANGAAAVAGRAGASQAPVPTREEASRLADGLNSPASGVRADLRLVDQIFVAYRSALRTGNPTGENAEITSALTGRNRLGFAFIAADNPAINARGELCDRWGTPYFFHQISGEKMEIRSAGPDRRLWTDDDVVLTP